MRKSDSGKLKQSGNALIYVIIAIALIGFLTVTLSNQGDQADSQNIDDEIADLLALELIEYSAAVKSIIDQMEITGTSFDQFDFVNPTSANFDVGTFIHKVYHPRGGGLTYKSINNFKEGTFVNAPFGVGTYFQDQTNVEWTPTTANDLIFSIAEIDQTICEKINEKITESTIMPTLRNWTFFEYFTPDPLNEDLTVVECGLCEGYPSLCARDVNGHYVYYNIVISR